VIEAWTEELATRVRALRDAALAEPAGSARREAAERTGGLPVYWDAGGSLAITASGEIVEYSPEDDTVAVVRDPGWKRVALVKASERYKELHALRPRDGVRPCDACHGSGKIGPATCARCQGIGWLAV